MGQSNTAARGTAQPQSPSWHPDHSAEIADLVRAEKLAQAQLSATLAERQNRANQLAWIVHVAAATRSISILASAYYALQDSNEHNQAWDVNLSVAKGMFTAKGGTIISSLQMGLLVLDVICTLRLKHSNTDFISIGAVDVFVAGGSRYGTGEYRRTRDAAISSIRDFTFLHMCSVLLQPVLMAAMAFQAFAIPNSERSVVVRVGVWAALLSVYSAATMILLKESVRLAKVPVLLVDSPTNSFVSKMVSFFSGSSAASAVVNYWSVCTSRAAGFVGLEGRANNLFVKLRMDKYVFRPLFKLLHIKADRAQNAKINKPQLKEGLQVAGKTEAHIFKSLQKLKDGKAVKQTSDKAPTCVVCLENRPDVLFIPCGHASCCVECVRNMASSALNSPKIKRSSNNDSQNGSNNNFGGLDSSSAAMAVPAASATSVEHECPLCRAFIEDVFYPAIW